MSTKQQKKHEDARWKAVRELTDWLRDKNESRSWRLPSADQINDSFARHLIFNSVRYFAKYAFYIERLTGKKISKLDHDVVACLLVGLTQLDDASHVSQHAAVSETVNLVAKLKKPYLKGFINANLRSFIRRRVELQEKLEDAPLSIQTSHEDWMTRRWIDQYGLTEAKKIAEANNLTPKLRVIVNPKTDTTTIKDDLSSKGFILSEIHDGGFAVDNPSGLFDTEWSRNGAFLVQDRSSQIVGKLVRNIPKKTLFDACASPGGKLIGLEWRYPDEIEFSLAADISTGRINRLRSNINRLGSQANLLQMDATAPAIDKRFELVLVDAPCGSTGTIQKHPGIKWHRRLEDFISNQTLQLAILNGVKDLVKTNHYLLYITCSIEREENQDVVESFLFQNTREFRLAPFDSLKEDITSITPEGYYQKLPDAEGMGLFAALMRRESDAV